MLQRKSNGEGETGRKFVCALRVSALCVDLLINSIYLLRDLHGRYESNTAFPPFLSCGGAQLKDC